MYIVDGISTISDSFSQDWPIDLKFNSEQEREDSFILAVTLITQASDEFFKNLSLSVLTGEYCRESGFGKYLDDAIKVINDIPIPQQHSIDDEIINKLNNTLLFGFQAPLRKAIGYYRRLHSSMERKYSSPESVMFFEAFPADKADYRSSELDTVTNLLSDFEKTLDLAEFDHNIAIKRAQLTRLVILYYSLEKKSESSLVVRLNFNRCCYITSKLLTRFKADDKNYLYAIDFEDKELIKENFKAALYSAFSDITDGHYSKVEKKNFKELVKSAREKWAKKEILTFEDYHTLIKYYKDHNGDESQLNELSEKFIDDHRDLEFSDLPFNQRSFKITKNYIKNNLLSYQIDHKKISIEGLQNLLNEIRSLQHSTEVKNFYPYLKACNYLISNLELKLKDYSTKPSKEYEDSILQLISLLEDYEKTLYNNFEWCRDRNFLAFQPPIEECIKSIQIENDKQEIFVASSIVLPINYEKVNKEIEQVSRQIAKFKTIFEIQNSIAGEKATITAIKEKIDRTDKRHIEILSIFAAIVLFVSGNIQVFAKAQTMADALRFMLVFGYVLTLFIVLIWLVTRETSFEMKKMPVIHKVLIFFLFISSGIALYLSSHLYTNNQPVSGSSKVADSALVYPKTGGVRPNMSKPKSVPSKSLQLPDSSKTVRNTEVN